MVHNANGRRSPAPNWPVLLIDINNFLSGAADEETIGRINREWSEEEAQEVYDAFSGKKRKGLSKSGIRGLLQHLEASQDDVALKLPCRILQLILHLASNEKSRKTKKEKSLVKADCVSTLCRVLRARMSGKADYLPTQIDEGIMKMLTTIGEKDSKFNLKVRLSDLISCMCQTFCGPTLPPFHPFYQLLLKCTRSIRNAQLIGKFPGLMEQLTMRISACSKASEEPGLQMLEILLHLMFCIAKIRKPRIQFINERAPTAMLSIVSEHLGAKDTTKVLGIQFGTEEKRRLTVVLSALGVLQVLATNKRAKDEMVASGVFAIAEREVRQERNQPPDEKRTKIVDSLCALCMRCMPSVEYPLEGVAFPLTFPLPKTLGTPNTRKSFFETSFEELRSSDDDGGEEDEEMFADITAPFNGTMSDDEDSKDGPSLPLPKCTKQTPTQLAKYEPFFIELRRGCEVREQKMTATTSLNSDDDWQKIAARTKHVLPFAQLPPAAVFMSQNRRDPLLKSSTSVRRTVLDEMEKLRASSKTEPKIVYDLDALLAKRVETTGDVSMKYDPAKPLHFESRFESGNLRRVTKVGPAHYEMIVMPDINQKTDHTQWFFFQVSNMQKDLPYTFEIINCQKATSMFGQGMQPVVFSQKDGIGWRRAGKNICYYRNLYSNASQIDEKSGEEKKKKNYYSLRFEMTFEQSGDVCYIAYHFPYTYTYLNHSLAVFRSRQPSIVYCREDIIGSSLAGNPLKMLTITAPGDALEISARPVVVLSARVHPGESNSSWIMHGILEELQCNMGAEARRLRDQYVFKIIPMLNVDGVVNGSHRCSLAGVDLNRTWDRPNEALHPEIYHAKAIIQYLCEVVGKKPYVYVDLHGHSKKQNCFFFGNNGAESWRKEDRQENQEDVHLCLPLAMKKECPAFALDQCEYSISRPKESSARVNLWRQFGVQTAYTLESTYSAFAAAEGAQITIYDLKNIGKDLLKAILEMENHQPESEKSED